MTTARAGDPGTVRVALVDDDTLTRSALIACLETDPEIEVVCVLTDGDELVARGVEGIDVVLIDRVMSRLGGIETVQWMTEAGASCAFVILTAAGDDDLVHEALHAGASGFLLKTADASSLVRAVHSVHRGAQVIAAGSARGWLGRLGPPRPAAPAVGLSARELEVLHHLCLGQTNRQIARRLNLSELTVKAYVSELMTKVGGRSRLEVVLRAFQLGLVESPSPQAGRTGK